MDRKMSLEEYLLWVDRNRTLFPVPPKVITPPKHPGRVLKEEVMQKFGITPSELAQKLNCPLAKLDEILNEKRSINPDLALQLEDVLGMPAAIWISLQGDYDLWQARSKKGA